MSVICQAAANSQESPFLPDTPCLIGCTLFNISNTQQRHLTWNDFMPCVSLTQFTSRPMLCCEWGSIWKGSTAASSKHTLWGIKGQLRFQGQARSYLHFLLRLRPCYPSCPTYIAHMVQWPRVKRWASTTQSANPLAWAWVPPRPLS